MPKVTEAVENFLRAKVAKGEHKGPDLIERFLKYGCNMEVQVNVACGSGEPVQGKRSTYTDGIDQWFNFRIPKSAYDDPFFNDFELRFPLDLHCEGIGSTGWDWEARRSRWVGFDFDSIVGHAEGVGVSSEPRRCLTLKSAGPRAARGCISMCSSRTTKPLIRRITTNTQHWLAAS
jgi:hypothetical protein